MSARTWMITGCSTGFGRVLAELLLARGERVVTTARKPETLADLVTGHDEQALALKLDITRGEDIERAMAAAQDRFGSIDVLVNNAGYGGFGTVEDAPIDEARAVFETNYFGTLAMIKAVLPGMIALRSGQIVNIGSVAGQIGFPGISYYSSSKFALAGLTEALGAEMKPLGIKVTLAELGPFETQFTPSMTFVPPSPHYDMAALSIEGGNSHWGAGHDARAGVEALLTALADPAPPRRLILGRHGLDVVMLHEERRQTERAKWLAVSQLAETG